MKWHPAELSPDTKEYRSLTMRQDGVQIVAVVTRRDDGKWWWRVEADGRVAWEATRGRSLQGAKRHSAAKQIELFRIYRSRGVPRADGSHTPDWVARKLGFSGAAEMLTMLADVDKTQPGAAKALNEWHQRGGSRDDLARFPRRQG